MKNALKTLFVFICLVATAYGQKYVVVKLRYFNIHPPYFHGDYRLLENSQLNEQGEDVFLKSLEKQTLYDRHFNEIGKNALKALKINPKETEAVIALEPALILEIKFFPKKIKAIPKYLIFKDPAKFPVEETNHEFLIRVTNKDIYKYLKLYIEPEGVTNIGMKKIIQKMLFSFQVAGYVEKDSVIVRDIQLKQYDSYDKIPEKELKKRPELRKIMELQNKIVSRIDSSWKPEIQEKKILALIHFMKIYDYIAECYTEPNPLEQNKIILPFFDKLMVLIKEQKIPLYHPDSIDIPFPYERAYNHLELKTGKFSRQAWQNTINKLRKDYFIYFGVHYKWKRKKDKTTLTPTAITFTLYDGIMPDQNLFTIRIKDLKKTDFPYLEFVSLLSNPEKIAMYPVRINDSDMRTCEQVKDFYKKLIAPM